MTNAIYTLANKLAGLTIGTSEVPVLYGAEVRPFSSDPADPRRVIKLEILVQDGTDLG